ncbi:sulfotransferase [Oscillatoriales cyanobacterium LEGE 11467]|uniref:Sulfotransferase n=1 Tax=Zarconia navalis LEGE 11467 TaxID=1828826 RepID=A0A928VWR8_9CYAN|nr:sulfotransferase [Zarconia navalis]MBE9039583.1 sulfotransferase [Zarconia navalis LEGE 11467]
MKNNFLLILGAMKCGTTSLFHYLSEHPQISPATNKEPHFFSEDRNLAKGMTWYRSLWDWKPQHIIAMEASTTYTMSPKYPNVPERIAQVKDAEFRFIYIMRHPFKRIESHMRHLLSGGHQKTAEIIEEHLAFSEYAKQLDAYTKIFGKDRIYMLLLEDLTKNPKGELQKICQFLQIDPNFQFQNLQLILNSNKTLNLHPALRKLYKMPAVKSVSRLVPTQFRQKLYKPLSRKNSYEVKLSDRDKAFILQRLQPDLDRLETEYGIDIRSKWEFPIVDF